MKLDALWTKDANGRLILFSVLPVSKVTYIASLQKETNKSQGSYYSVDNISGPGFKHVTSKEIKSNWKAIENALAWGIEKVRKNQHPLGTGGPRSFDAWVSHTGLPKDVFWNYVKGYAKNVRNNDDISNNAIADSLMAWDAADGVLDGKFKNRNYATERAKLYEQGKAWPKPKPNKPPDNTNPAPNKPPRNTNPAPPNPAPNKPPRNTNPAPPKPAPTKPVAVATENKPAVEAEVKKESGNLGECLAKNKWAFLGGLAALFVVTSSEKKQQAYTTVPYSSSPCGNGYSNYC